jgi:hypothetical protein
MVFDLLQEHDVRSSKRPAGPDRVGDGGGAVAMHVEGHDARDARPDNPGPRRPALRCRSRGIDAIQVAARHDSRDGRDEDELEP